MLKCDMACDTGHLPMNQKVPNIGSVLSLTVPSVPLRVGSIPSLVLHFVSLLRTPVFDISNVQSESSKHNHVVLRQEEG
jgi:hypothetical protein